MKQCSHCKKEKAKKMFLPRQSWCRDCRYKLNKEYRKKNPGNLLLVKIKKAPSPELVAKYHLKLIKGRLKFNPYYKGMCIDINQENLTLFFHKNWDLYMCIFKKWADSNYIRKFSPSIDRINVDEGYTIDNLGIVPCGENTKRALKDRWGTYLADQEISNLLRPQTSLN